MIYTVIIRTIYNKRVYATVYSMRVTVSLGVFQRYSSTKYLNLKKLSLPSSRLASSWVKRTLANLLWQYARTGV